MKREDDYLYIQLSNTLRNQINSGQIKPGESLISENDLARHYSISRVSVRKSLQLLVADGLIITQNGRRAIVNPAYIPRPGRAFRIFADTPSYFVEHSLQEILTLFRSRHPEVDVQLLTFPKWVFWDTIENMESSGLRADLILLTDSQLRRHESEHAPFVDLAREISTEELQIYPKLLQTPANTDSVIRALPLSLSTVFLVYNPDLFREYGVPFPSKNWSLEDFLETSRRLTIDSDKDGITDLYGFCVTPTWNRWPIIAQQYNVSFHNLHEDAEQLAYVLELIRGMAFRERTMLVYPRDIDGRGPFYYGKAAMTLTTNVELGVMRANGLAFEPKIAQLPFGPVRARRIGAIYGMVPEHGDTRLAVDFLHTVLGEDIQEQFVRSRMYLSVRRPINEGVWDQDDMEMIQEDELMGDWSTFLQEMFPSREVMFRMDEDMALFWSGVESVGPLIERLKKHFPQAEHS
ncbi:MAG: GntR family transcriptional regulator [Paenibacillus sp.]|jgi:multiple sugar transport system substrate-binding protein|nr:GntR family transcriptional regulator [Paenibacillus sp.]